MKTLYSPIFLEIKKGKSLIEIKKELKISKQNLNYHLRQLQKKNLIRKEGNGYYSIIQSKNYHFEHASKKREIRGHAFIWTIKLNHQYSWKEKLEKVNLNYKLIRNYTPRIFINNKKIWLGKKSIVIYEANSFYGINAIESRKYAVISLIETLQKLELKLNINLRPYIFKPAREHFGIIKNDLAIQCNRSNEKIHISDDVEGEWLWIDDSLSLGELETGGKKALTRNIQVQKWYNDHKKHNFEVTPTFLMESIKGLIQVQQMNANNIIKHQKVLDEMLVTLKKIQESLDKK